MLGLCTLTIQALNVFTLNTSAVSRCAVAAGRIMGRDRGVGKRREEGRGKKQMRERVRGERRGKREVEERELK